MEKVQLFLTEEFQLIHVEGRREIENHHCTNNSNNFCRQYPQMDANIGEQMFEEKQDICIVSGYVPPDIY